MYLTRLDLQTNRPEVARLLGNEQRIHAVLCKLCNASRQNAQILYRLVHDRHRQAIYMYSRERVDRARLPRGFSIHGERDLSDLTESIKDGQELQFDLVAVPSKKIVREDGAKNSRRVVLRTPEERIQWLQRKAEQNGFQILHCTEEEDRTASIYQTKGKNRFITVGTHFAGLLLVTDAAAFRRALSDGIGPEKAYGFGMLMVKHP